MNGKLLAIALVVLTSTDLFPRVASAESDLQMQNKVIRLEQEVQSIRSRLAEGGADAAVVLFGAFCALSAQNTNRNPWLWFFLGLFFSVITVLVLLYKNSKDPKVRLE